jgi:plastocyanin
MRKNVVLMGLAIVFGVASQGAAYEAIAVADGGTLAGQIKAGGTTPTGAKFEVTKDPEVCGKEKTRPDVLLGANKELANAVVMVKAAKGKKLDPPAANPVFDQKACEFIPHVLLFPAGSTIDVTNSDGILHNIHTTATVNPSTNQAQPKFKPKINIKVEKPEFPIKVVCDAHNWMSAWWVAMEHPYYAVTDASGNFKIGDLPAGDYEVDFWHETLGKKTEKVSIKPKEETKVAWELSK